MAKAYSRYRTPHGLKTVVANTFSIRILHLCIY